MATVIMLKKGRLNIEKALKKMDWNTDKFEEELEMLAKTQPSKIQEKMRKQYNRYMAGCGWPMELVVVSESLKRPPKIKPPVKTMGVQEMAQQIETKPVSEPETQSLPQTTALAMVPPTVILNEQEPREPEAPIPLAVQEPNGTPQEIESNETETKTPEPKELHGYIVMPDAVQVKNLLKLINVLVDESTFKLTPQGLTHRCMDPSRVAMIDLVIPRESFEEHSCTEEIKFSFNVERYVDKVLKNITKTDAVRLDIQTGIVEKMITRLSSKLTRQFSTNLLECSDEEVPTPKISFNYSAKLVLEDVNNLFKDIENYVQIVGTQDSLTFEQKGDLEDFTATLKKGDATVLNIEANEDVRAKYLVSYLKEILKALNPLVNIIEVSISTNMPIRISAELEHLGTVSFYVAPRIQEDD